MAPINALRHSAMHSVRSQYFQVCSPVQIRLFSQSAFSRLPRKGNEDRESINTERTENTKSGTDDASARQDKAAFDPETTDPRKEKNIAGEGNEESGNPLDVSPASPEVSRPKSTTEPGSKEPSGSGKSSGGGSPKKDGVVSEK